MSQGLLPSIAHHFEQFQETQKQKWLEETFKLRQDAFNNVVQRRTQLRSAFQTKRSSSALSNRSLVQTHEKNLDKLKSRFEYQKQIQLKLDAKAQAEVQKKKAREANVTCRSLDDFELSLLKFGKQ
ncbi:hypothetical protein RCL1_006476 [Eukaryota sp. TZLM3-RCL]